MDRLDRDTRPAHQPHNVRAARRNLFNDHARELLESLGSGICDPTRANIVRALTAAELTVGDLARVIDRSVPITSQHLTVLRQANIVHHHRRGRYVYNALAPGLVPEMTRTFLDTVATLATPAN